MADDSTLSGADIRKRFQTSDSDGTDQSAPAPGSGADIRLRFRAADDAAAKTTPPTAVLPGPGVPSPDEQSADTGLPLPISPPSPAFSRIGQAVAEGWQNAPTVLAPGVTVDPSSGLGVNRPLVTIGNALLGAGSAAFRGLQQAVVEATPDISLPSLPPGVSIPLGGNRSISGQLTPGSLGRELAALPEAFPTGVTALRPPGRPPIPEASPPGPSFVSELTAPPRPAGMTDAQRINQLVEHAVNEEQPAVGPPMARGPATQAPSAQPGGAPAQGQFLNRDWISAAGDVGGGVYDMGKGADALTGQVRDALARGDTVQLATDGGNKTVDITGINKQGMMVDAKGQPWGSAAIAFDGTGREGIRITPRAGTPPSGAAGPQAANPLQPNEAVQSPASTTAAPSARITPIVTQSQAGAEADRIIRTFAGKDPVVINSAPLASGAQPTLSQSIEGGHGGIAALERGVRDVPEQTQHFVARETDNTTLRNQAVGDVIGDPRATDVAEAELNTRTRPQEATIFDPKRTTPVDPSDTISGIDDVLNGPQGQRDVVRSSLQHIRDKLVDKDGKLQTDPALLRGVDLSIGDMIGPKAAGTAHDGRQAAHQLMAVRDNLRDVIEQGAPGYKDFLANQAAERSAIDGQRFLQARNITDRYGNVNLGTLDSTIKAAESQQAAPGARLADGVTDEQLARLKELRADYRNDAKQRLGTSLGSPTVQKLGVSGSMAVMGHPLLAGGAGIAGAWAAGVDNPLLGAALGGAGYLLKQQSLKGQRMVMDALRDKLLNPDKARSAFRPTSPP